MRFPSQIAPSDDRRPPPGSSGVVAMLSKRQVERSRYRFSNAGVDRVAWIAAIEEFCCKRISAESRQIIEVPKKMANRLEIVAHR
jgi:hypothetical protein